MLKIIVIDEMRTILQHLKRALKPCSSIFLLAKIDLISLTLYHWQSFVSKFRENDDITKFLAE